MGRQAYITRLALGRSAYEEPDPSVQNIRAATVQQDLSQNGQQNDPLETSPSGHYVQQYNARGHPVNPASRALARTIIRAQNDVLATVGVCVGTTDAQTSDRRDGTEALSSIAKKHIKTAAREDRVGLAFLDLDLFLLCIITWWVAGLRYRLQAFPSLRPFSLLQSMKMQSQSMGLLAFFFAGLPAYSIHVLDVLAREYLLRKLFQWISSRKRFSEASAGFSERGKYICYALEGLLRYVSLISLAPIEIHGILQQLSLIPPYPLLPSKFKFYWTTFYPQPPTQLPLQRKTNPLSMLQRWTKSLLQSSLLPMFAYTVAKQIVENITYWFIMRSLARLSMPDPPTAIEGLETGRNRDATPGPEPVDLDAGRQSSNRSQLISLARHLQRRQSLTGTASSGQDTSNGDGRALVDQPHDNDSDPQVSSELQAEQPASAVRTISESFATPFNDVHDDIAPMATTSSGESTPSNASPVEPPVEGVRVAHHRGDRPGAVTLELEVTATRPLFPGPTPNALQEPVSSGTPSYPTSGDSAEGDFKHRFTCLSLYPINSLCAHLASHLATWITLPLEAVFVRRLVTSFLTAAGSSEALAKAGLVAPQLFFMIPSIDAQKFPGGQILQRANYPRQLLAKLTQCMAIELMIGLVLYDVGCRGVSWYGSRYFSRRKTA